jgi:hypothetical protein
MKEDMVDIGFMRDLFEEEEQDHQEQVQEAIEKDKLECYELCQLQDGDYCTELLTGVLQPLLINGRLANYFLNEWQPKEHQKFHRVTRDLFSKVYSKLKFSTNIDISAITELTDVWEVDDDITSSFAEFHFAL